MRMVKLLVVAAMAMAVGTACVGGSKGLSSEDKEKLAAYIMDNEPADLQHKVDINFENKVHLIGYKAEPELAKPGTDLKITWYWRCDDTLDDGWSLFTHIHDDKSDKSDNIDWVGPLRENRDNKMLLGPSRWEKGKIYADEQTYKVPDWVAGSELTFMLGIWKGNARLRIVTGPNDGDNRGIAAKLKTGIAPAAPVENQQHTDVPTALPYKLAATDKITIDGKGDDKAWGGAPVLGPFVEVGTGKPNTSFPVNATAKLAYDDKNLYVLAEVRSADVVGGWDEKNKTKDVDQWTVKGQPKCWTKDTLELMIEPDADGSNTNYYEIQISPQNKVFHSQYDGYNDPKTEPNGPFGHEEWDPKMKTAVTVRGKLLDSYEQVGKQTGDAGDNGYTVEAMIPFASFNKPGQHPPNPGETWRLNFYAMRQNNGVAWAPILGPGNFHKANFFGRVTFGVIAGAVPGVDPSHMNAAMGLTDGAAPPAVAPRGVLPMRGLVPQPTQPTQ